MSWLIDTNLISLCHKRYLPARLAVWLGKNEAECFISAITIAEMRFGVELSDAALRDVLAARVEQTESDFAEAIEAVDMETLIHWKRIFAFLKSSRRTLPCEDTLLAAQCLAKGHVLATDNTRHFAVLEPLGLRTENPLLS